VPVVAALVQYRDKVVLARNSQWPDGVFSLITGYLERNETPQQAVIREVREEIGLECKAQEFIGCYSLIERNQIILAHWVTANGEVKTGNEIAEIRLLSREELKLWKFGSFVLTADIVRLWLEKTAHNEVLQPMSVRPLSHH